MQATGWEMRFIHALRMHLDIVIPVTTVFFKILIRVFSRDEFSEVIRSVSNVPLELMLISVSFILGALCGLNDNYIKRLGNQSDADLYAAIAIVVIFFLSIGVNQLNRFCRILFEKLSVAYKQYHDLAAQPNLPGAVPSKAVVGRIFWAMAYCIWMVLVLSLSFAISVLTLAYVLHLIQ